MEEAIDAEDEPQQNLASTKVPQGTRSVRIVLTRYFRHFRS